jgi:hypothetical protein
MDDRTKAAWAATAALAFGGLWLLFASGPGVQSILIAVVAASATFLVLDLGTGRRHQ